MEKEVVTVQSLDAEKIKTATKSVFISSGKKIWTYIIIVAAMVAINLITTPKNEPVRYERATTKTDEAIWGDLLTSLLPVIIIAAIYIYMMRFLKAKNPKKLIETKARYFTNVTYTINNAFFKKQGEGFEISFNWEEIYRIKETPKFYLIFQEKLQAHVIDKAQLDPWQLEDIKEIFESVKPKVKVSLK